MDFDGVVTADPESLVHQEVLLNMRRLLWRHQQHLRNHPDPSDEWWFLVNPDAEEPR